MLSNNFQAKKNIKLLVNNGYYSMDIIVKKSTILVNTLKLILIEIKIT